MAELLDDGTGERFALILSRKELSYLRTLMTRANVKGISRSSEGLEFDPVWAATCTDEPVPIGSYSYSAADPGRICVDVSGS